MTLIYYSLRYCTRIEYETIGSIKERISRFILSMIHYRGQSSVVAKPKPGINILDTSNLTSEKGCII